MLEPIVSTKRRQGNVWLLCTVNCPLGRVLRRIFKQEDTRQLSGGIIARISGMLRAVTICTGGSYKHIIVTNAKRGAMYVVLPLVRLRLYCMDILVVPCYCSLPGNTG